MTNEEMERTIQFIVGQQSQFSSDILQLKETTGIVVKSQTDLTKSVITVVGMIGDIAEAQKRTVRALAELSDQLNKFMVATDSALAELSDRLNRFIMVVERHISGNGKEKPSS